VKNVRVKNVKVASVDRLEADRGPILVLIPGAIRGATLREIRRAISGGLGVASPHVVAREAWRMAPNGVGDRDVGRPRVVGCG
jgi:hypothetical protein